jgi:signal transduction histidine kinase
LGSSHRAGAHDPVGQALALLADELISPLGQIRHAVQVIRARTPSPEELQWATNVIDRQTDRMARLVEDVLDVSRVARGAMELRHERLDIAAIFQTAVKASRGQIERSHHQLRITPPPEPLYVDGDATRLTQVVSNLLDHAAEHTDPGGQISLSGERDGKIAVIRVKDTGVGIPSDMLPRVFKMFTHAERSSDRAQGGLGVGLALVEHLVRLHGGTVTASSPGSGKGSQFMVRLPVADAHKAPGRERAQPTP